MQLEDTYKNTEGILIANTMCDGTGSSLCDHYNVPYYPYIIYGTPSNHQEYDGDRSYSDMLRVAKQNLGPAASMTVDGQEVEQRKFPVCEKKNSVVV